MSKNVIAYNCDFLEIKNGAPFCNHPEHKSKFCHPYDLACDVATFKKIYGDKAVGKPCIECEHFCQSQVYDSRCPGTSCAEHELSRSCSLKERCKAKVLTRADKYGWCKLHNKPTVWYESCADHRKEGGRDE